MMELEAERETNKFVCKMQELDKKREKQKKTLNDKVKKFHNTGQLKMNKAQFNHQQILKDQEELREHVKERCDFRMNRAFNNSMSLPKAILSDMTLLVKSPSERAIEGQEKVIVMQEFKRLKEDNLANNLLREQKKLEFKKNTVIEKEMKYMDKIRAKKNEKLMLEKCKIEVFHQSMKNKEQKHIAII